MRDGALPFRDFLPTFALRLLLRNFFRFAGLAAHCRSGLVEHYILPSTPRWGRASPAVMARFTRASFVEILRVTTTVRPGAKGLSEWAVIVKHGLRNALILS